jgi:beta-phosphoglucomutase-like phosphatase (HAD superfamily)
MLGAQPEECIVVEDSPLGIEAGKNAGMLVAALKSSVIAQDTSASDFEMDTFEDLINFMCHVYKIKHLNRYLYMYKNCDKAHGK